MTKARLRKVGVTVLLIGVLSVVAMPYLAPDAEGFTRWSFSEDTSGAQTQMRQSRSQHTATKLIDGRILVVGGNSFQESSSPDGPDLETVELYDPVRGTWRACQRGQGSSDCPEPLHKARRSHTATLLKDGKVLVVGSSGDTGETVPELYEPSTGKWTQLAAPLPPNGPQGQNISSHTATLLEDGRVLLAAINGLGFGAPQPGILYNPAASGNPWSQTRTPTVAERIGTHFAILLSGPNCGRNCGKVLIGGHGTSSALNNRVGELFDPATDSFAPTTPLALPAPHDDAVLLDDGRVLVAGPEGSQLYDPATEIWTASGRPSVARRGGDFLQKLPNGHVLAAGGNQDIAVAELFYPDETGPGGVPGVWRPAGAMQQARQEGELVALDCTPGPARALVAGGYMRNSAASTWSALSASEILTGLPSISSVDPAAGSVRGGALVRVRGKNLNPAAGGGVVVNFGSVRATEVTPDPSGTSLSVRVPPGPQPVAVDISVFVDGIRAETCPSPKLVFNYLPVPRIDALTPALGPATGGSRVTLTGSDFTADSSVLFGGQRAASIDVSKDGKRITAVTPASNPGEVPVTVSSPAGDVQTVYKYVPAITGVAPGEGPPAGGTTVTIAGKGFAGARMVTFDGIEVAPTQVADGLITVKSPPHPPGQVRLGVDVPPHGPAIPVAAGADTFTYGAEAVPLGGGSGQTSVGGSTSVAPGSQAPPTSGGGPSAAGGSAPPPPAQGQTVPLFSQSPVSAFEPGSSAMQSGSASPVQSPGGVQAPGAAGSQAPGPQPALVSVPEFRPDRAEQYAMVAYSGKSVDPAGFGLAAGLVGLLLCGGLVLGRREAAPRPQARPQEAY